MQHIIQFILEVDKLKNVTRANKPVGQSRNENAAEHSWQIALLALAMQRFAQPEVDISRAVKMLLLHDIGEIDIGDTIIYANIDWQAEKEKELAAVKRIFGLLNHTATEQEFLDLWLEFEHNQTATAQFANALDRAMPPLLNLASNGQSWVENSVSYEQVVKRIRQPIESVFPELWQYIHQQLAEHQRQGWFGTLNK
ncbi:HD domain-containing protein [Neisseria sp. CCUG17229]|uniref:HD domain-containing protein n=1 Tax=Neisseria sp. CCUG17229 TaxID=3392036 RepID=UPI003A0FC888